jgi:hypothetical protein
LTTLSLQEPTPQTKIQTRSATNPAIFVLLKLQTVKLVVVDNVLGLHLPLAQVRNQSLASFILSQIFLSEFTATATCIPPSNPSLNKPDPVETNPELDLWTSKVLSQRQSFRFPNSNTGPKSLIRVLSLEDPKPRTNKQSQLTSTIKSFCECLLWGEYFNSMLKCWEPLLDPFVASLLYEQVCSMNQFDVITYLPRIIEEGLVMFLNLEVLFILMSH